MRGRVVPVAMSVAFGLSIAVLALAIRDPATFGLTQPGPTAPPAASVPPITSAVYVSLATTAPVPERFLPSVAAIIDEAADDALGALLAVAKLLSVAIVLALSFQCARLIWSALREGVRIEVSDATGDETLSGAIPGLTQLAKDDFSRHVQVLRASAVRPSRANAPPRNGSALETAIGRANAVGKAPWSLGPERADEIGKLLTAVKDIAPVWVQLFLVFLSQLLPPRNSVVTAAILALGDQRGEVGVRLRVAPLNGESLELTMWESADAYGGHGEDKRARVNELLRGTMQWAAIVLFEREALVHIKSESDLALNVAKATVHNFAGVWLTRLAHLDPSMYERAEREFAFAQEFAPDWFLPYENLADALSFRGLADGDGSLTIQERSVAEYSRARDKVEIHVKPIWEPDLRLTQSTERQIAVAQGISRFLSGGPDAAEQAHAQVNAVEGLVDVNEETNDELLYTLASWYATLWRHGIATDRTRSQIGMYLVAAIVRSAELADSVGVDPDFNGVDRSAVSRVLREVQQARLQYPTLGSMTGPTFGHHVMEILRKARWPGHVGDPAHAKRPTREVAP